ncbi:MAG: family 1 glycosylhydrolase [Candidatus Dojkabacteria bacterium]|jgi:beta-glucosidase|nr:family 1 glycosylhydrolase [Candidatus Dojkabacteria bacterium]
MSKREKFKFPKDFLWGAATSSHQIEGGLTNNWSEWEDSRLSQLSKEQLKYGKENYRSNSKYSCDSYNHYKEDVKVLKELGLKAYRFSIEWSRVEPEKGVFDFEGLQYYKNLVKELRANGIEPVVTLWHWTVPIWLRDEGGVFAKDFKRYFLRMSKQVLETISSDVKYWITINEPEVFSMCSYLTGEWPPNKRNIFRFLQFYIFTFPSVHKGTYELIKGYNPESMVSFAKNDAYIEAYNRNIWNVLVANISKWFASYLQLDLVKNHLDFIGLNYYFHHRVGILGIRKMDDRVKDVGWWYKSELICPLMEELHSRYHLPILITENGLADSKDEYRAKWIEKTVNAMSDCMQDGVDIIGYLHWSLLDNFEWSSGFRPKFGLISVDPESKARNIKDSAKYYSEIVKNSGII